MTEVSRAWNGTTLGHAGPYTYQNWNDVWGATSRASVQNGRSADYNIGVFYAITNALAATINGANIDVNTGASQIDGLYHENDATVSVPITAAAAGNERKDLIVVRRNYQTAVTYTPAGGAPTVPPHEAHITVIRGSECVSPCSPATPAMTQDTTRTTYWDIPIATVEVDDVPNLTNLTDLREYVDAETKRIFVQIVGLAYNNTLASDISVNLVGTYGSFSLPSANNCDAVGWYTVPNDFINTMTIYGLTIGQAAGNVTTTIFARYGADGQVFPAHLQNTGAVVTALGNSTMSEHNPLTLSSVALEDNVLLEYNHSGVSAVTEDFLGWIIEYFGWKK